MRIHSFFLESDTGAGGTRTLARFSVDLGPISIHQMLLKRKPDGTHRSVASNLRGQSVACFNPELASRITAAALTEWRACARVQPSP